MRTYTVYYEKFLPKNYILSEPPQELNLEIRPFLENPLVVIARKDHPLAGQKKIPIKRLQGEPFIMREMGSGIRRAVQQIFLDHGITLSLRLEIGNNEAIKQAVAGGLGISVLSQHVLNLERLFTFLAYVARIILIERYDRGL